MIIIADSGSTKTEWIVGEVADLSVITKGINPVRDTKEEILEVLSTELMPKLFSSSTISQADVTEIHFYGAGCIPPFSQSVKEALGYLFPQAEAHVYSDLLGAARALCSREEGIACILGTGSNSCLFDGEKIIDNTPSLGYILGDEGSGAHLGRQLISDCIKKQLPKKICDKFFEQYDLTVATILEKTYHNTSLPNRWLASFTPFLSEHRLVPEINTMLKQCFKQFFQRNTMTYRRSWLPIHIIGNIGIHFSEEIKETAESLGLSIGNIVDSPINGLIEYHKQNK